MSVCCPAVLLSLLSGLYHVHGLRVSSLSPVARWHYLPPLSFQKLLLFSLFPPSFSPCILSFLSSVYWPFRTHLLACVIRAAILYFSCRLHLFTSRCFVIGSPDKHFSLSVCSLCFPRWKPGYWGVSLELVMVSLAFHLFVVGTVFALCSYDCSRPLLCCRQ